MPAVGRLYKSHYPWHGGRMAEKKYYAVKKGKITGVFNSWPECKDSVDGYSGAEYMGFRDLEEA